jgi:hypothetical protein
LEAQFESVMHQSSLNKKEIYCRQKIPGKFYQQEKNPENIFPGVRKIYKKYFQQNPDTPPSHNTKSLIPSKTPLKPKFSDVIAIAGNQGHLLGVSPKKPTEMCLKKSDRQKPH